MYRSFAQDDGDDAGARGAPEQMGQPPGRGVDCLDGIECQPHDIEVPLAYHITYDGHDYEPHPGLRHKPSEKERSALCQAGPARLFYSTGESFDLLT